MDWKRLVKGCLYPPLVLMILLIPVATVLLVWSMVAVGTESAVAIVSYVLSAYTLTVWCFRIPYLIRLIKRIKNENQYARRLISDARLRVNISLAGSIVWNIAYAAFQFWLGYVHKTFWFHSLAVYYVLLIVMRTFLMWHTARHRAGEDMRTELKKYRACGWVFLFMNLALSVIVFFMIYWNRTFTHHEITTIAMAAYTFTAFTVAIVNVVRYRRYNSPVYSASKATSFAAACVSMLTLTSTMLTTFGDGTMDPASRRLMLALVGAGVSAVVLAMAIAMILQGNRKLRHLRQEMSHNTNTAAQRQNGQNHAAEE